MTLFVRLQYRRMFKLSLNTAPAALDARWDRASTNAAASLALRFCAGLFEVCGCSGICMPRPSPRASLALANSLGQVTGPLLWMSLAPVGQTCVSYSRKTACRPCGLALAQPRGPKLDLSEEQCDRYGDWLAVKNTAIDWLMGHGTELAAAVGSVITNPNQVNPGVIIAGLSRKASIQDRALEGHLYATANEYVKLKLITESSKYGPYGPFAVGIYHYLTYKLHKSTHKARTKLTEAMSDATDEVRWQPMKQPDKLDEVRWKVIDNCLKLQQLSFLQ